MKFGKFTEEIPKDAMKIGKRKVYAASKSDINDLLCRMVQVGEIGGGDE